MPILYVASSKTQQEWGADVGLGKHLYKVGITQDDQTPEQAVAGCAGLNDWKILKSETVEMTEDDMLARLSRKEKLVDGNYYPKLRGAQGIVKVTIANVENSMLVALALENRETPKSLKAKPADIAKYLMTNAQR